MVERDPVGTVALATLGALAVVVASVGAVAILAEWAGVWGSYFLMEQTVAAASPVATALAGLALLAGVGVALRS